jgi:mRNA-degrading endonuclease RelE of RelBE toxin-antitoxin system
MTVRIQEEARKEIRDGFDFYNHEKSGLGSEFLDELKRSLLRVSDNPFAWPKLSKNTRKCIVHRFPFVIIYSCDNDELIVHAVAHFRRKPDYWKYQKGQ